MQKLWILIVALSLWGLGYTESLSSPAVQDTMDQIVTRFYDTLTEEQLARLDDPTIQRLITDEERHVLASKYWCFEVNVPAIVSVMRDKAQSVVPFWLPDAGFTKTDLTIKNAEGWEYEVWQKKFDAGRVELGINGFDKHRPHYFVGVAPQRPGAALKLSNFIPKNQTVSELREGSLTYHDWTELVLTDVPEALRGQVLLTTIRGRAREAHLIGAFRKTPFPSSTRPDQVVLTWSEDPRTSQTIQWRTKPEIKDGLVRYREKGAAEGAAFVEAKAACESLEDRLLANDRYINRFNAVLRGLKPATAYLYSVGSPTSNTWSDEAEFITAPDGPAPFTFVFMGDTHCSEDWGKLLTKAFERRPQTAFYMIGGDLVGTGLYRDEWDRFFQYSSTVFNRRPVVPCLGNHDDQDGLGAWMYCALFGVPENGPSGTEPEHVYSFEYENAIFISIDVGSPLDVIAAWMEQQLARTKALWKFVMFHFPPYAPGEDYPDIRQTWGAVFDKYHVDMVLSGHVHHYLRTYPIKNQKRVASPAEGTVYVVSIAIPDEEPGLVQPDYAAVMLNGVQLYQTFDIDGGRLLFRAYDIQGRVHDELIIEK
jgi:hypothetical protein